MASLGSLEDCLRNECCVVDCGAPPVSPPRLPERPADERCPICLGDVPKREAFFLPCCHKLCIPCGCALRRSGHSSCPICRRPIQEVPQDTSSGASLGASHEGTSSLLGSSRQDRGEISFLLDDFVGAFLNSPSIQRSSDDSRLARTWLGSTGGSMEELAAAQSPGPVRITAAVTDARSSARSAREAEAERLFEELGIMTVMEVDESDQFSGASSLGSRVGLAGSSQPLSAFAAIEEGSSENASASTLQPTSSREVFALEDLECERSLVQPVAAWPSARGERSRVFVPSLVHVLPNEQEHALQDRDASSRTPIASPQSASQRRRSAVKDWIDGITLGSSQSSPVIEVSDCNWGSSFHSPIDRCAIKEVHRATPVLCQATQMPLGCPFFPELGDMSASTTSEPSAQSDVQGVLLQVLTGTQFPHAFDVSTSSCASSQFLDQCDSSGVPFGSGDCGQPPSPQDALQESCCDPVRLFEHCSSLLDSGDVLDDDWETGAHNLTFALDELADLFNDNSRLA